MRWITKLEQSGITTTPQYLSLGDTGAELRQALADLLDWPASTAANIPKLAKGVVPRAVALRADSTIAASAARAEAGSTVRVAVQLDSPAGLHNSLADGAVWKARHAVSSTVINDITTTRRGPKTFRVQFGGPVSNGSERSLPSVTPLGVLDTLGHSAVWWTPHPAKYPYLRDRPGTGGLEDGVPAHRRARHD